MERGDLNKTILIKRQGSSEVDLPPSPRLLGRQLSNWWKGQPARGRVHSQISPRTAQATCQLLPIVGPVVEMWTVVREE